MSTRFPSLRVAVRTRQVKLVFGYLMMAVLITLASWLIVILGFAMWGINIMEVLG